MGELEEGNRNRFEYSNDKNTFKLSTHNKFGTGGVFEPLTLIEQEEIDNILKEHNISPMRSQKKEETQKLNFESNFNFDYVDEDEMSNESERVTTTYE